MNCDLMSLLNQIFLSICFVCDVDKAKSVALYIGESEIVMNKEKLKMYFLLGNIVHSFCIWAIILITWGEDEASLQIPCIILHAFCLNTKQKCYKQYSVLQMVLPRSHGIAKIGVGMKRLRENVQNSDME